LNDKDNSINLGDGLFNNSASNFGAYSGNNNHCISPINGCNHSKNIAQGDSTKLMIDELNLNSVNGTQSQFNEYDTEDNDIPTTKEIISNLNKNKFSKREQEDSK
jgi:hypothetical protein